MSGVKADPDELVRFVKNLKQFNSELRQRISRLNGQFSQLGSTWRDQEHQKFAQEYQKTMKIIQSFLQSSDDHIPVLLRKADILYKFLNLK